MSKRTKAITVATNGEPCMAIYVAMLAISKLLIVIVIKVKIIFVLI